MSRRCRECGFEAGRGWRSCPHCGARDPRVEAFLHSLFAYVVLAGLAAILVWMVLSL
jgi:hypothetical protein